MTLMLFAVCADHFGHGSGPNLKGKNQPAGDILIIRPKKNNCCIGVT